VTSAFGGQHSIQLSYGCIAGRRKASIQPFLTEPRHCFNGLFGKITMKNPRVPFVCFYGGLIVLPAPNVGRKPYHHKVRRA
jgi:hypothetical protein